MKKEWVKCFMPNIEGNSSRKPTLEPLIPIPRIVCEVRSNPETNEAYMIVNHTH